MALWVASSVATILTIRPVLALKIQCGCGVLCGAHSLTSPLPLWPRPHRRPSGRPALGFEVQPTCFICCRVCALAQSALNLSFLAVPVPLPPTSSSLAPTSSATQAHHFFYISDHSNMRFNYVRLNFGHLRNNSVILHNILHKHVQLTTQLLLLIATWLENPAI